MQRLCGARRLVVIYTFARTQSMTQMTDQGIPALRFPVSWDELKRVCCPDTSGLQREPQGDDFEVAMGVSAPARLFDDRQLAMASTASTTVKCECPHHLSELILSLSRFETYSAECENRSREDAALHAFLHIQTARARLLLEEALVKVVEVEGLSLTHSVGEDG